MGLLYTRMKIFHFKEKIDSLPVSVNKILAPVHIRIKPTNTCNHNCRYCAYRTDSLQLGKDMVVKDRIPREKMMEIINDIAEMGVKSITFSGGGEPFCYPYLLDAVRELSCTPVKFASLTNGSLLNGEVAEVFAHKGTWLRVSIDGWDDESYSAYRGTKEKEFTKVMKNMEDFKRLGGKCYLGVCIIVDRKNASHIYELAKRLKGIGVDSVKIAPCLVSNSGRESNEYHKPIYQQVRKKIARIAGEFGDKGFEVFDSYHSQLETFEKEYNWCPYIQVLSVIGADLNVYSCQDKAYNIKEGLIGSIKNMRFKDFWFSDKNKFFRIDPSLHCAHHCVADGKNKIVMEYLNADREHMAFV
jgi:MoaA/NifB/PqqE/SkfB family radical SAM enzyme